MFALTWSWAWVVSLPVVGAVVWRWRKKSSHCKERYLERDRPADTVILHQFGPAPWVPSISPFVMKLETYLRATGIPYVNCYHKRAGPKGKLPWIQYNSEVVADSQMCMEFLNRQLGKDLNRNLSAQQLATGHVIRRTVEEFLYWSMIMMRLNFDPRGSLYRSLGLARPIVWYLKKVSADRTDGQGIGRHSREEVERMMEDDLSAIQTLLGERNFLFGDSREEVTEFDCALFGQLCQLVWQCPGNGTDSRVAAQFPSLLRYCERMRAAFWPDWNERLSNDQCPETPRLPKATTSTTALEGTSDHPSTAAADCDKPLSSAHETESEELKTPLNNNNNIGESKCLYRNGFTADGYES